MIEFINSTGQAWLRIFVNFELQNSVFIFIIFILLFLFKNYEAGLRKQFIIIGLIKTLVPPFIVLPKVGGMPLFPAPQALSPVTEQSARTMSVQQTPLLTTAGILFTVWILGMGVIFFISVSSLIRLHLRVHNAKELSSSDFSLPERTKIYLDRSIKGPLVFGWLKPKILLPARWDILDKNIRRTILTHEINHIRNRDLYFNTIKIMSLMLHFMNPLNWLLVHYYELYTELTCDDRTIEENGLQKEEYGALLLRSVQAIRFSSSVTGGIGLSKAFRILKQRLTYQLKRKEPFAMKHSKRISRAVITFLLLATIPLSTKCSKENQKKVNPVVITSPRPERSSVDENGVYAYYAVDTKPEMLYKAEPRYPEAARKAGIEGTVVLTVTIDEDGNVAEAVPLEEVPMIDSNGNIVRTAKLPRHPELEPAAIAAAKECRFDPAEKDGHSVKVKMNIPFRFRLK